VQFCYIRSDIFQKKTKNPLGWFFFFFFFLTWVFANPGSTAANVVEKPADPFRWLKKPPALPFAAYHSSWDYGIVFAYGLATP
jgi:hypothetical protein